MHDIQKDLNRSERLAMMQRAVDAAARTPWITFPEEPAPPRIEDIDLALADLLQQVANGVHPMVKRLYFSSSGLHITRKPTTVRPTPGRNDPCSCGSGKKYKKCCGA